MNKTILLTTIPINYIIISILLAIIICILIFAYLRERKYQKFVLKHSKYLKELDRINQRYSFTITKNIIYTNEYDNYDYFDLISPLDYLIYQLVENKEEYIKEKRKVLENLNQYDLYLADINELAQNQYDVNTNLNPHKLGILEKELAKRKMKKPKTTLIISVELSYKNENKYQAFSIKEIDDIIEQINNNCDGYYNNKEIFNSLCRVERGKVTNAIRKSIYERDNYKCLKCGKMNDLEIDHIIPISKGGKSTMDNLQTLCHKCNKAKGNIIETSSRLTDSLNCPICKAPLKLEKSAKGNFYACSNYPKCQYTKFKQ